MASLFYRGRAGGLICQEGEKRECKVPQLLEKQILDVGRLKDELAEEAERIDKDPKHSIEQYIKVKSKLDVYEQNKCMGAITRSREKYAMKGERCTGYFLGLEKRKQERVYIEELENENGEKKHGKPTVG